MSTIAEAIRRAAESLGETSDTARLDAELLMAFACQCSRSELLLRKMRDNVPAGYDAFVRRRMAQEPVAYITGFQEFYGRSFRVTPDVLIPRGDSETIVAAALEEKPGGARVLDCGVGSGALLVSYLLEAEASEGVGIDRSQAALQIAEENAQSHGIALEQGQFKRADWNHTDWTDGLGTFDLIIANPPYVETTAELGRSVRDYEPAGALFAGDDGLDDYRVLIPQLVELLRDDGAIVLEIGHQQDQSVAQLAHDSGFETKLFRDLAHRPRALLLKLLPR